MIGVDSGTRVEAFSWLYKDGVLYHSESYHRSNPGKRNNSICVFREDGGNETFFGALKLFISHPEQCALVKKIVTSHRSLMQQAGPPCREVLEAHKDTNLLDSQVKPVSGYGDPQAIPLTRILGKAVLLCVSGREYVVFQPNPYEVH